MSLASAFSLRQLDRRVIYLLVLFALGIPLAPKYTVPPARMDGAEKFFQIIEGLNVAPGDIAFVSLDWGPNTLAENGSQSEVVVEHLLRRRIPFALFSQYYLAESFLDSLPRKVAQRLMQEDPNSTWEYGKDWANLGYRPGSGLIIQSIPKSENLVEFLKNDASGTPLSTLPAFQNVRTLKNIKLLSQMTGLVGTFDSYVQFFQTADYRPIFTHGCTSITIPEAYIYMDSGQLSGLLEGVAGAAWYSELLRRKYPLRPPDAALLINTGLGIAHLVLILLIVLGNVAMWLGPKRSKDSARMGAVK